MVDRSLAAAGIASRLAFDRVPFGGNRVTRLTLLPEIGASDLNTVDLVEPSSPHNAHSDVDVLVEFLPGHVPGLRFVTIERDLSELLHG